VLTRTTLVVHVTESGARYVEDWRHILSVPLFGALLWAIKGFAPTRLALVAAAAGFLAGAGGALICALHCPEMAAPVLDIWHVLGMLIPAAIGAVIGPWTLPW
jgi:hypothetical protein